MARTARDRNGSARSGGQSDRTGHPGAAEAAIAARILGEILLMVILGEIERPRRDDLRRDRPVAARFQRLRVSLLGGQRRFPLRLVPDVDAGRCWEPTSLPWRMPWVGSWLSQKS